MSLEASQAPSLGMQRAAPKPPATNQEDSNQEMEPKKKARTRPSWKEAMAHSDQRRRQRYAELFGEQPATPPTSAWELRDNLYICHVTQQAFTTGSQVRDHLRSPEYQAKLVESNLEEDPAFLEHCELYAKAERERRKASQAVKRQTHNKVLQQQLASLKEQVAKLSQENRQLRHLNLQLHQKAEKQGRQLRHYELLVDQMQKSKKRSQESEAETTRALRQRIAHISEENRALRRQRHTLKLELDVLKSQPGGVIIPQLSLPRSRAFSAEEDRRPNTI